MGYVKLFRGHSRLFGSVFAVAALTVGVIAIVSAGPSTKSAAAQTTTCAPGTTVPDDLWSSLRYRQHHRYRCQ